LLFDIVGKHIEISEALKIYAKEKTSKLPRFYNSVNHIEVVIDGSVDSPENNVSVEIIVRGQHKNMVFVVTEAGKDAYKCIDFAVRKLERQLRRHKNKERNNKHTQSGKPK